MPTLLAQRRAASARRIHTVQIPAVRAVGFAILCVIAVLQDVRSGAPHRPRRSSALLIAINLRLRRAQLAGRCALGYGRTGRLDLGLLFLHLDVLVWLPNLHHLEQAHLFFAYLLLMRVADQVGFGFRRALYFSHVVVGAYLAYSVLVSGVRAGRRALDRPARDRRDMYLLGIYLAFTGLGDRAPAQPHAAGDAHGARAGRQPRAEEARRSRRRRASSSRRAGRPSRPTSRSRSSWRRSATRSARR